MDTFINIKCLFYKKLTIILKTFSLTMFICSTPNKISQNKINLFLEKYGLKSLIKLSLNVFKILQMSRECLRMSSS